MTRVDRYKGTELGGKPDRLLSWVLFGRQSLTKVVGLLARYSEYSFVDARCMNARTVYVC